MGNAFPRLFEPGRIAERRAQEPHHQGPAAHRPGQSRRLHHRAHAPLLQRGGAGRRCAWWSWSTPGSTTCTAGRPRASWASPAWTTFPGCRFLPTPSRPRGRWPASRSRTPAGSASSSSSRRRLPTCPGRRSPPWAAPSPSRMTTEEISGVIKAFGRAAARAQMAGFDLVEIHACHGYLISNFLSPYSNKRDRLVRRRLREPHPPADEHRQGDQGPGGPRLPRGLPL